MHRSLIITICLEVLWSSCQSASDHVKAANNHMDLVSSKLKNEILSTKLDSVKLPDFDTHFKDKILFVTSNVNTKYRNGRLHNLRDINRLGDCVPNVQENNKVRSITCTLQFNHPRVDYDGSLKYGRLPRISIKAKVTVRPLDFKVMIETNTTDNRPKVKEFYLIRAPEMDVSFKGMGLLNSYLRILKRSFAEKLEKLPEEAIRKNFKDLLNKIVSEVKMEL